jgi:hypothetical protein
MTEVFSPLATNKADGTATATDHAAHHNAMGAALNVLRLAEQRGIINAELPPFNASLTTITRTGLLAFGSSLSITGVASTDVITATGHNF